MENLDVSTLIVVLMSNHLYIYIFQAIIKYGKLCSFGKILNLKKKLSYIFPLIQVLIKLCNN